MDHVDFDEGLRPFVDELGRYEDENFDEDMKAQLVEGDMALDVHRRVHLIQVRNNDDDRSLADKEFRTLRTDTWVPVGSGAFGLEHEFTSRGGTLSLAASLQMWRPPDTSGPWTPSNLYVQLAFEVDGSLFTESVIGDQDTYSEGLAMETGMEGLVYSASLEAVLEHLTPGAHTVRVVLRAIHGPPRYATNPDNVNNAADRHPWGGVTVGSREFVIIEDQ